MMWSGTGGKWNPRKACDVGDEVGDEDADEDGESIVVNVLVGFDRMWRISELRKFCKVLVCNVRHYM